jgi:hypothetical protein
MTHTGYMPTREDWERAQAEIARLRTRAETAEAAIGAMWPIFALALAYSEHGRASEHNWLRKLADEARTGGLPKGVMDTILDVTVTKKGGAG